MALFATVIAVGMLALALIEVGVVIVVVYAGACIEWLIRRR